MITVTTYESQHFGDVKALWIEAFPDDRPWNVAEVAIPAKLACQPELFLVALDEDRVVGSVMAGYTGHRGWIDRIATRISHQRQNVGGLLMREAESRLQAMGCIKINLQVLASNYATTNFYKRMGYVVEDRISMSKLITSSHPWPSSAAQELPGAGHRQRQP